MADTEEGRTMIATAANPSTERDTLISLLSRRIVGFAKSNRDLSYPLGPDKNDRIIDQVRVVPIAAIVSKPGTSPRDVQRKFKVSGKQMQPKDDSPLAAFRSLLWFLKIAYVESTAVELKSGKVYGGLYYNGIFPTIYLPRGISSESGLSVTEHELQHAFADAESHLNLRHGRNAAYNEGGGEYFRDSAEVQAYSNQCLESVRAALAELADRSTSVFKALRMEFEDAKKYGSQVDLDFVKSNARSMQAARTAILRILKTRKGFIRECLQDDHKYGEGFTIKSNGETVRNFLSHIRPIMDKYLNEQWDDISRYDLASCEYLDRYFTEAWEDLKNQYGSVITESLPASFSKYINPSETSE